MKSFFFLEKKKTTRIQSQQVFSSSNQKILFSERKTGYNSNSIFYFKYPEFDLEPKYYYRESCQEKKKVQIEQLTNEQFEFFNECKLYFENETEEDETEAEIGQNKTEKNEIEKKTGQNKTKKINDEIDFINRKRKFVKEETKCKKIKVGSFKQVCLVGSGGTGKTEIVKALATLETPSFVYLTLQHRLLRDVVKRTRNFSNLKLEFFTITKFIMLVYNLLYFQYHRCISRLETIDINKLSDIFKLHLKEENFLSFNNPNLIIYVDEFSQIGIHVSFLLIETLKTMSIQFGSKILLIFVGDDKQIPPIYSFHIDNSRKIMDMFPDHFFLSKNFRSIETAFTMFLERLEILVNMYLFKNSSLISKIDLNKIFNSFETETSNYSKKTLCYISFLKKIKAENNEYWGLTSRDLKQLFSKFDVSILAQALIKKHFPRDPCVFLREYR